MGLEKILEELHEAGVFQIIPKRPNKSLDLDSLMDLLFKEGMPDQLVKNLSNEEKEEMMQEQPEQNESIWNSIRNFFSSKKGNNVIPITNRKTDC